MPAPGRPVAIDTDPGVDDALALMLALRSPELRVELITTVAGNVPVTTATANVLRLLALLAPARWPPVAQGAARPLRYPLHTALDVHGPDGLGGITALRQDDGQPRYPLPSQPRPSRQAVSRLVELVARYRGELTLIALGPLTNIARAIQRAPDTMRTLGQLVIMGGAIGVPGNVTPAAEFNVFVDPHAAEVVLGAGIPTLLVPLDVTRQVRLTHAFLERAGRGSRLAQAVRDLTRALLRREPEGLPLHDPLAVAVALDPSLVCTQVLPLGVETRGQLTRGMTIADRRTPPRRETALPQIRVALDVDAERALALFAARVLRPSRRPPPAAAARVTVVGSANLDYTVVAPHLPAAGETVLGRKGQMAYGGKGANQAVAAKRAGAEVVLVAKLGQDPAGQDYVRYLRHSGLNTAGLRQDPARPTGMALITVDRHGQNQIAVAPGANAALAPTDLEELRPLLTSGRVLLVQLETPLPTVTAALRVAKEAGMYTLLNPAPARRLPAALAPLVDLLVPNRGEAATLCGLATETLQQAAQAALALRRAGFATVVITLGADGLVYTEGDGVFWLPALPVPVRDTTAAGDTFVGYLAWGLAAGWPLRDALPLANAAAALAVTRVGAQPAIPWRDEAERLRWRHAAAQRPQRLQ
ncbi:MAG: hypothetical protein KatS3mg131_1787 [Candidatus Tectimicrobiota bacterium]|nr:MAG: hypothetical protein KatS3mg131_1787 [Candidatus Tectomicrobia bacterium]